MTGESTGDHKHDALGDLDRSICGQCNGAYVACSVCEVYFCDCTRRESTGDSNRTTPSDDEPVSELDALLAVHYPSAYNCGCGHPINSPEGWARHVEEVVGASDWLRADRAAVWDDGYEGGFYDGGDDYGEGRRGYTANPHEDAR